MNIIIVDKNSNIDTINKALLFVKENEDNVIKINKGIYHEKVKINTEKLIVKSLKLLCDHLNDVVISYNDYAKKIHQDGLEYNTFRTYTLMILGNNVTLENLVVENTSGDGKIYGQGVAVAITGNNIFINNCKFLAHQDTLFLGPLPKDLIERYQNFLEPDELVYCNPHKIYINNSYIEGDVDFIFGSGEAYFNSCEFKSLNRDGFVFAPSTEKDDNEGFVVNNSLFTCEKNSVDNKLPNVFIARPWRDYGKITLINSIMDNHINDFGFDKWNDTRRDMTCRFNEINSIYFDKHMFVRCPFVNRCKK